MNNKTDYKIKCINEKPGLIKRRAFWGKKVKIKYKYCYIALTNDDLTTNDKRVRIALNKEYATEVGIKEVLFEAFNFLNEKKDEKQN